MMWLKLLIVALVITAFLVTAMWMRLVLDKGSGSEGLSCHPDENGSADNDACDHCQIKDIADCDEKPAPA